jgi:magnesium transporter
MLKNGRKRSAKSGLPPGTPVYIGKHKTGEAKITVLVYDETTFQEKAVNTIEDAAPLLDVPAIKWVNIDGIHQLNIVEEIGKRFHLHSLTLEDVMNTNQRPKVEDFGDYLYIVLKNLSRNAQNETVEAEQISIVLGEDFVITFQENEEDNFTHIRERLKSEANHEKAMKTDFLAYSLIDEVVDNYFTVIEGLEEEIELLDEELVSRPTPKTMEMIHKLKGRVFSLHKSVWPLREVINNLERDGSRLIHESTRIYIRDIYDHTIQMIDTIEIFRDMLYGMIDIYLSSISNRLNEVMKVLTIIATIFMPLTFIAGVYGMNFKYMPELDWPWGYPAIWLIMLTIGISMLIYFKKKKWL